MQGEWGTWKRHLQDKGDNMKNITERLTADH